MNEERKKTAARIDEIGLVLQSLSMLTKMGVTDSLKYVIAPIDKAIREEWPGLRDSLLGKERTDRADPEPLPAWQPAANPGEWERGDTGTHVSQLVSGIAWAAQVKGEFIASAKRMPSIWHAMHAADAALLAAGHTLTDPAPEPPDLSGVTFSRWEDGTNRSIRRTTAWGRSRSATIIDAGFLVPDGRGKGGAVDLPTITTREAADAFLRACGAMLAEETDR